MKVIRRPSPALVVSIVALVMSCGGTAAAARFLITSSKQIKNGAVTGADVRDGSLTLRDLKAGVVPTEARSADPGGAASEAYRKTGPELPSGGSATVATLDLPAGAYAIFAKTNLAPSVHDDGLLNTLLKSNKTIEGRCRLDAAGDVDESAGALVSPGSENVLMLSEQITRTLGAPGRVTLSCGADNAPWHASDASIVAVPVGRATRIESTP